MSESYFSAENLVLYHQELLSTTAVAADSVHLIVTSPPYNVDLSYRTHKDNLPYQTYLDFTLSWLKKCYLLAKEGGRLCLNIPLDKNKGGQKPICADFTALALKAGWRYHSTIIWNEGNLSRRTAWGSWLSASAPYVIAPVEVILVLYKNTWKREKGERKNDITKEEFMEWTNGLWTFSGQSKKGAGGHPAAFPLELPRRCIRLFSFVGDTVLDPFLGSGSTLIAAALNNRKGIGIEKDAGYCQIAVNRIKKEARLGQKSLF